ncbi:MAG: hypothetical protein HQL19_06010 [Candidatus Omnitrophica bacterium]|nr:hypothetical protein [Candidatus Omnitrophota bacterium]
MKTFKQSFGILLGLFCMVCVTRHTQATAQSVLITDNAAVNADMAQSGLWADATDTGTLNAVTNAPMDHMNALIKTTTNTLTNTNRPRHKHKRKKPQKTGLFGWW